LETPTTSISNFFFLSCLKPLSLPFDQGVRSHFRKVFFSPPQLVLFLLGRGSCYFESSPNFLSGQFVTFYLTSFFFFPKTSHLSVDAYQFDKTTHQTVCRKREEALAFVLPRDAHTTQKPSPYGQRPSSIPYHYSPSNRLLCRLNTLGFFDSCPCLVSQKGGTPFTNPLQALLSPPPYFSPIVPLFIFQSLSPPLYGGFLVLTSKPAASSFTVIFYPSILRFFFNIRGAIR